MDRDGGNCTADAAVVRSGDGVRTALPHSADKHLPGIQPYAKWITPAVSGFLKLPAATGTIESEAFYGIPAEAVIIPATVNSIAYDAFHHSGVQYIYGFPGTRAESFADAYGYTFVPISNGWLTSH